MEIYIKSYLLKSLNSDYFEEKLTAEFRNSEEFKKYDKKISEVIRNIFFIAKNKRIMIPITP